MIFRQIGAEDNVNSNGLFVNDMLTGNMKPISADIVEKFSPLPKGKIITGTFGIFNIKDFERMAERLKHDTNCLCI